MHFSTFLTCSGLAATTLAAYTLQDDYIQEGFFDQFTFFTGSDPTEGYVNFVDQSTASSGGLISSSSGVVHMGVDNTTVLTDSSSPAGRNSVRLTSNKSYNHGLIIIDLAHMPGGECGTWPAFWMFANAATWPDQGEIDIIEGVNSASQNAMTLHTTSGCSVTNTGGFTGSTLNTPNCDVDAAGQSANAGCSFGATSTQSFGQGFNSAGGGVYATEWTSQSISIWFFPRGSIPSDINSGSPDPSGWGLPTALFAGGCNIDQYIQNQNIIFDTTFCGEWAGAVWSTDSTCAPLADTCQHYVEANPGAFSDAYWEINALKVYSNDGSTSQGNAAPSSASSSAVPVASSIASPSAASQSVAPPASSSVAPSSSPAAITSTLVQDVVTSTAPAAVETVTALSASDFPDPGQQGGIPEKRKRGTRRRSHLAEHLHVAHGHS